MFICLFYQIFILPIFTLHLFQFACWSVFLRAQDIHFCFWAYHWNLYEDCTDKFSNTQNFCSLRTTLVSDNNTNRCSLLKQAQTGNLSKNLHHRIFGLKILHHQFHLILTVLVRKNTKNEWKMEKFTPLAKNFTLPPATDGMDKFHLWLPHSI